MNGQPLTPDQCHAILTTLLAGHDWQLLTEPELYLLVMARLAAPGETPAVTQAVVTEEAVTKAAINLYCAAWHRACGTTGARRARAYTELAHYLYDRALHKYRDRELAQEVTHEAILLVAQQLDHCHNPGAFMAFALLKLWNAATAYFRARDRQAQQTQPMPEESEDAQSVPVAPAAAMPERVAIDHALTTTLFTRVGELMVAAPRAQQQLKAVMFKFLYDYSDQEIADALATDLANVHVLRSRGLKRLRGDAVLQQLFAEMVRN